MKKKMYKKKEENWRYTSKQDANQNKTKNHIVVINYINNVLTVLNGLAFDSFINFLNRPVVLFQLNKMRCLEIVRNNQKKKVNK